MIRGVIIILFFVLNAHFVAAQPEKVWIGVNGLTCSQCTRNVEMQLRKLGFVADVVMNLEHTNGMVTLKPGLFDPLAIAAAVRKAGFSLRYMEIDVPAEVHNGQQVFRWGRQQYMFANTPPANASCLRFAGSDYLPKAQYKKWKPVLPANVKPGIIVLVEEKEEKHENR